MYCKTCTCGACVCIRMCIINVCLDLLNGKKLERFNTPHAGTATATENTIKIQQKKIFHVEIRFAEIEIQICWLCVSVCVCVCVR